MRYLAFHAIALVGALVLAPALFGCEESQQPSQQGIRIVNVAFPSPTLFADGEASATFKLAEVGFPDQPSPEKELLNSTANQQAIALLLKEERNKGLRQGLSPPGDKDSPGIKIRFDAIRFLRDAKDPTHVRLRLVGPVNEVECKRPMPIAKLLESKDPIPVRFESVTNHTGVKVTITTDAKLKWNNGDIAVTDTKGTFNFLVGRLSPARLFYSSDSDSVALPDFTGKRVPNESLPRRSLLEPEKL